MDYRMNSPLTSNKGLTLVEVLVAGVIGIIPAALISVLYIMYNGQLRENNVYLLMQRQYETVVQQLALNARSAHKIIEVQAYTEPCQNLEGAVTTLFFFDNQKVLFAGVRMNGNNLEEFNVNGGTWTVFMTGSTPVLVNPANSSFVLPGCRNKVTINLRLTQTVHNQTFNFQPPPSEVLCRN